MSGTFYAQLRKRLKDLAARGSRVAKPAAGLPAARIHKWIKEAEECLSLLEDKTSLKAFQSIKEVRGHLAPPFELKVYDSDTPPPSKSAHNLRLTDPQTGDLVETDVLLDFRFDQLAKANEILTAAATKLEIDGHSLPTLGEELRAARERAGHTQEEAAVMIADTCDHKYVSEWEAGKRKPRPGMAKKIRAYIKKQNEL